MNPEKKRFPRLRLQPLNSTVHRVAGPPLGIFPELLLVLRPRHLVIVGAEAIVESERFFKHGGADEGRRVPSLLLKNAGQRPCGRGSMKPPVFRTWCTFGYWPVKMLAWEGGVSGVWATAFFKEDPALLPAGPGWAFESWHSRSSADGRDRSVSTVTTTRFNGRRELPRVLGGFLGGARRRIGCRQELQAGSGD